jgi:hypothetical protein
LKVLKVYETAEAKRSYDIYIPVLSERNGCRHTESGTSGKSNPLIKDFLTGSRDVNVSIAG